MKTKFVFENGSSLTPGRQRKLVDGYRKQGVLKLPVGYRIQSIQGITDPKTTEMTTIIIVGLIANV